MKKIADKEAGLDDSEDEKMKRNLDRKKIIKIRMSIKMKKLRVSFT